ncbi:MAG: replicative DNA helicase, partial [Myxococcota bacterium]
PVDLHVLSDHLKAQDRLERVGGIAALVELANYSATAANIDHYARIVRDKSIKRSLIQVVSEIARVGYEDGDSSDELLDAAESKIFSLSQDRAQVTLRPLDKEMHDAVDFIDVLMNRGGELTGLPTGFPELDKMTGGLQPGDFVVLAARPSMGKTALVLNVARNAAVDHGRKVAVFSLEMTARALVLRMLSSESKVDFSVFRSGLISVEAHGKLMTAAGRLADASIWIDDSSSPSILELRAKARRLHAQGGLDLIIVDYLQLVRGEKRRDSREQEISEISRGLKGLAKELNVPVIGVSQLNRGPESRGAEDKRPMLSDLRESGAIEQDADLIGFIYRDVVYNRETEYEDLAELIIGKQRNGPIGTVKLQFLSRYAEFISWSGDDPYAGASGGGDFGPAAGYDPDF